MKQYTIRILSRHSFYTDSELMYTNHNQFPDSIDKSLKDLEICLI